MDPSGVGGDYCINTSPKTVVFFKKRAQEVLQLFFIPFCCSIMQKSVKATRFGTQPVFTSRYQRLVIHAGSRTLDNSQEICPFLI